MKKQWETVVRWGFVLLFSGALLATLGVFLTDYNKYNNRNLNIDEQLAQAIRLQPEELPALFRRGVYFPEINVPDGTGLSIQSKPYGATHPWITVKEDVFVYPNYAFSQENYQNEVNQKK